MTKRALRNGILALLSLTAAFTSPAYGRPQPNIVVFFVDDLGKEGLSAYGTQTYQTPQIDSLAKQGTRFTKFYTSPVCLPTRNSLVTGMYPSRNEFPQKKCIDPNIGTFMQELQRIGYTTAAVGKYDLCHFSNLDHPRRMGFDEWMISKLGYWGTETVVNGVPAPEFLDETRYMPEEHTKFAVDFINRNAGQPFFLYFSTFLVHTPWHGTPDTPDLGWPENDPRYYPYMVSYMDKMILQIKTAVWENNLHRETVIIFLSDNGAAPLSSSGILEAPYARGKTTTLESGVNVPLIIKWPGFVEPGSTRNTLADVTDLFPTILEMAGLPAPIGKDGYSLLPSFEYRKPWGTGRAWAYGEHPERGRFWIRKGNAKLREDGRFYNLLLDPFEERPIFPENDTAATAKKRLELESILIHENLGF